MSHYFVFSAVLTNAMWLFPQQVGHPGFVHEWNRSSTAQVLFKSQWVVVELTSSLIPYRIRSEWPWSPENSDFPKNEADSLIIEKINLGKILPENLFCSGLLACVLSASDIGSSKRQSVLAEVSRQITAGMGITTHIPVSSYRQSHHLTNILKI